MFLSKQFASNSAFDVVELYVSLESTMKTMHEILVFLAPKGVPGSDFIRLSNELFSYLVRDAVFLEV